MSDMFDIWEDEKPKKKKKKKSKKKSTTKPKTVKKKKVTRKKNRSMFKELEAPTKKAYEGAKKTTKWAFNSKPSLKLRETVKTNYHKLRPTSEKALMKGEQMSTRILTHEPKFCPNCGSQTTVHRFPNGEYGCYKCNTVWGKKYEKF